LVLGIPEDFVQEELVVTLMLHGSNEEGREVILLNQLVCPTNLEREREGGRTQFCVSVASLQCCDSDGVIRG